MSLTLSAAKRVYELKAATVDDLMPHFPEYSRKQVIKALSNAVHDRGWITCDGHRPRKGAGRGRGSEPTTYRAKDAEPQVKKRDYSKQAKPKAKPLRAFRLLKRQIPSVFHLAAQAA